MSEIQTELPPLEERPLVTFALFAYNQEKYIREAIEGAFAQTYEPLEIILSDDCSTDRTFEIARAISEAYVGPHRLILNRNERNIGISAHFSKVVEMASAEHIVIAAGDDISFPDRAELCMRFFQGDPNISFVQTGYLNFSGDVPDLGIKFESDWKSDSRRIFLEDYLSDSTPVLLGASRAIRKSVFSTFPALNKNCPEEDKPSIVRLLMTAPARYVASPAIHRRVHGESLSDPINLSRMNSEGLLEQFKDDAAFAQNKQIIDRKLYKRITVWASRYVERRRVSLAYMNSKNRFRDFFVRIVPCGAIPIRQKIYELKKLISN